MRVAEKIPGPTTQAFMAKAKEHKIFILAGSIVELGDDGKLYDTCSFIGPDGNLVGKVSIYKSMLNTAIKHYSGSGLSLAPEERGARVFDTELCRIGIVIGEDRYVAHEQIFQGKPDIIFNISHVSERTTESTIENLSVMYASRICYVVMTNVNGLRKNIPDLGDYLYDGNSCIINPVGKVYSRTTVSTFKPIERMAVGLIDMDLLKAIRANSANPEAAVRPW